MTTNIVKFKKVTHVFLSGKLSSTLIIPIDTARKYGLDKPANVILEEREDGILIKKVDIKTKEALGPAKPTNRQTDEEPFPGVSQINDCCTEI